MRILLRGFRLKARCQQADRSGRTIVKQHRGELHPQIAIYADQACEELVGTYPIAGRRYYFC